MAGTRPRAPGTSDWQDSSGATAGTMVSKTAELVVSPKAASTGIYVSDVRKARYTKDAGAISGGGHIVAGLDWVVVESGTNAGLLICQESKLDNAGAIGSAVLNNPQLSSNTGSIGNVFGNFPQVASNAGTITVMASCSLQIDDNTGTITYMVGQYIPTLAPTGAGSITGLYGLYFAAQSSPQIVDRFCVYNLDAGAPIYTQGPVVLGGNAQLFLPSLPPASASAPGGAGQIAWDSGYLYVCVANNSWKRAALSAW